MSSTDQGGTSLALGFCQQLPAARAACHLSEKLRRPTCLARWLVVVIRRSPHQDLSAAHLPDTALGCSSNHCASLSAYPLPRFLTHSVLSGCCGSGSTAHCSGVPMIRFAGRASGSGGYGRSACVRVTGTLLAAKVSIAAMRIPTAAATTLSSSAFAAMWMLCIAPTPRESDSEGYCAKRPDASLQ